MNQAKIKDRILADIKAFKPLNEVEGLDKYLLELERDGLVKVWRNEQGKPISVRLTNNGQSFISKGGDKTIARQKDKSIALHYVRVIFSWIMGIVATVIGGWIVWKLTR